MKTRIESNGDLPLGKTFNILSMIFVAASAPEKDGKFYTQFFLHECVYKL